MLGFLPQFGMMEWLVVLAVILLLFGASRIPALARSLGKSVTELKKGLKEGAEEIAGDEDTSKPKPDSTEKK